MRVPTQLKTDPELVADFLRYGERLLSVRVRGKRVSCMHYDGYACTSWSASQALMCSLPYAGRMTRKRQAEIWREFKRQIEEAGGAITFPPKLKPSPGVYVLEAAR